VADDAAYGCTTDGSDRAAAGKNGAADGADTRTDGGILVLRRHPGTRTQAEQHGYSNGTECVSLHGINGVELIHNHYLNDEPGCDASTGHAGQSLPFIRITLQTLQVFMLAPMVEAYGEPPSPSV
jgi:hypothetical protein